MATFFLYNYSVICTNIFSVLFCMLISEQIISFKFDIGYSQLERYHEARQPGTSWDLRGWQCGTADISNHESGSAYRITGIRA